MPKRVLGMLTPRGFHNGGVVEDSLDVLCGERLDGEKMFHGMGSSAVSVRGLNGADGFGKFGHSLVDFSASDIERRQKTHDGFPGWDGKQSG